MNEFDPLLPAPARSADTRPAFHALLDRALEVAAAPAGLHDRVRRLVRAHTHPDTPAGEDAGETLLVAVIETALHRVLRERQRPREELTVAALVDRVGHELWDGRQPDTAARALFYRLVAGVLRRTLRRLAERDRRGTIPEVWEPVNDRSLAAFDAAEALLLNDWWDTYAAHSGPMAALYAVHRFAGRGEGQLGELFGLSAADVREQLGLVRHSIDEFRKSRAAGRPLAATAAGGDPAGEGV